VGNGSWTVFFRAELLYRSVPEGRQLNTLTIRQKKAFLNGGVFTSFGNRHLGSRRIQSELKRVHNFNVSRTTIDKILWAADAKPLFEGFSSEANRQSTA